jgi:4-hydroxy-tetrahydrodipicolinate synthase
MDDYSLVSATAIGLTAGMNQPERHHLWSATPTPLTDDLRVDVPAVARMVDDAVANGLDGLFVAGSCGEGPWLPDRERNLLIKAVVAAAAGRLKIGAQVSDNSPQRIIDNMHGAAEAGADYALIAPPGFMMNATPDRIAALYEEAAAASPLPVGIYDLGERRQYPIPSEHLGRIYALPNVVIIKDSSGDPRRRDIALAARAAKPGLQLHNGIEFQCIAYLEAGYDGLMFGGAAVVARMMRQIVDAWQAGDHDAARALDARMRALLFGIYGGESLACWLTGLKYYMLRRGIFSTTASYLGYPLTDACKAFIDAHVASAGDRS